MLAEVAGLPAITLQPAAGSQGELTGLMLMRAYFEDRGEERRHDRHRRHRSRHESRQRDDGRVQAGEGPDRRAGNVDVDHLRTLVDERTAGLMLTNPSTLGLFDENIAEVAEVFHDAGALLYYDGANLNAVCGISRPGDMGFDIVHFNLHKTFSQPHGGGGPGGGPLAVQDVLEPFLPAPVVERRDDGFGFDYDRPKSIGKVRGYYGPFGVFVRSYAFMRAYGPALREMSEVAVLNANYLLARLREAYDLPFDRLCMHEFVLSARTLKREHGITALDVAKRLMDYGFHPPTVYFPLIVPEALMIEPTETETKEMLDAFADAMIEIAREAEDEPEPAQGGAAPPTGQAAGRGQGGEARGREVRVRGSSRPGGRGRARSGRRAGGDAGRSVSDPIRWTRPALEARLEALEGRHTGNDLINAIVEFAATLTDEDRRLFQDVLLKKRRPTRPTAPAQAASARRELALRHGGELPACGGDVAAAREPDRRRDPRADEHPVEGGDRVPRRTFVHPRRVVRDEVDLEGRRRARSPASALACSTRSLTPASITYSTKTRRRRRRAYSRQHSRARPRADSGRSPASAGAQARLGRVQREREPDRLLDLVHEPAQPGQPADGRDRRPPVRDPDVREAPRRFENSVEVHHRLAHPHEDAVVDRLDPAEVQNLVEDLGSASGCAPKRICPVAQKVQVSGQPDCADTHTDRRPSRKRMSTASTGWPSAVRKSVFSVPSAARRLVLDRQRRERNLFASSRARAPREAS